MDFSVLLSIYKKETADHLCQCMDSIFSQTLLPNEVVLVEDGPLTPELYAEIERLQQAHPELITVPLEQNQGLGASLNVGLKHCHYDIVARMDTDDISRPERFKKQYNYLQEHPEVDVVSGWITEFVGDPTNEISIRNLPEEHDKIYKFGKIRNPINHPTVMFRKHAVEEAGGYLPFPLFEDYYLWVRMLCSGHRFHNLQESLLLFRRTPEMMLRRGGVDYAHNEISFQRTLRDMGYITTWRMIKNIIIRYGIRVVPNQIRSWFYSHYLRIFVKSK